LIKIVFASIADDQELDDSPNLKAVISRLTAIIGDMCKLIADTTKPVPRINIHVNRNDRELGTVCMIEIDNIIWHMIELLHALYHMAINDQIKHEIYHLNGMSEHLRVIIYNGNCIEVEFAVKMLWQLCFDPRIAEHVREDAKLMKKIDSIKHSSSRFQLKANCANILWQLNNSNITEKITTARVKSNSSFDNEDNKHVMISYNSASREACLRIKKELENLGYKVWIDVDSIHGSSLESMANAIEKSWCVLMCMTENYKQSTNCRAEAEYAFQLKRPIVPILMQQKYKPDGWLGKLIFVFEP
jgi:hypothetical protein